MMKGTQQRLAFTVSATAVAIAATTAWADPPSYFDLRDVEGVNYVTSVKNQQGGTCWTHGAMAAMEGNLLMTGAWANNGESGEPALAEYHLDWWNGFNSFNNDDDLGGGGLEVHQGGDYMVTTAYLTRGEGAVRDIDGQSYETPPPRWEPSFHLYYPRDVEWYVAGEDLSNINTIKYAIMNEGVLGTCMCYSSSYIQNYIHYQPPYTADLPNHAVAIVGWDDSKVTQAPDGPGAWIVKNSWGTGWGLNGYFWISYYDKWSCQEPQMGAVSMQDVEPMAYDSVYYHDYHGWRDTMPDCTEAFNAFVASYWDELQAVNFFTAADNVDYVVKVYDRFEGGELLDELASVSGSFTYTGFHTVDLPAPITVTPGEDFYVYLQLSAGGHPLDRTSDVPVLLGASYRTIVKSAAKAGESYYRTRRGWLDLYDYEFDDPDWNGTANFCIKGLGVELEAPLEVSLPEEPPEYIEPGVPTVISVEITNGTENYVPDTGLLHYRFDGGEYLTSPFVHVSGDLYEATLPGPDCGDVPEFYFTAEGDGGSTVANPILAPDEVYTAIVGTLATVMHDDFETDQGWVAENLGATSGDWQRGVPVNDPSWDYDPASDSDGSGQCYLTQNEYGNTDVDDGAVRLTSPTFDMSGGGDISYDYYLYLTDNPNGVDRLLVEINSNDGEGNWTEIARHDTGGGTAWRHHQITEAELIGYGVDLTATMRIRYTANDADPQSIVEAGLDAFFVTRVECEESCPADFDGDGDVDTADLLFLLGAWGTPDGDVDGDGDTDTSDLLALLAAWGDCP